MCGRFVQIVEIDPLVKRFGVKRPQRVTVPTSFNVAPGDLAYVITNEKPDELQAFQFAFTPSWAKKKMYLINARAEGDFNKENDPHYEGELGIAKKPAFRTAIRSKRCLVIASGFYEGPEKEKLDKPFYISKKNGELFSFAGIWDTWTDPETGEMSNSFGIITVAPNSISQQIGHHRSPLILNKADEQKWLDDRLPLEEVLGLLKPYPGEELKADPISIKVKNPRYKSQDLIVPVGQNQASEPEHTEQQTLNRKKSSPPKAKGKKEPQPRQGSLF